LKEWTTPPFEPTIRENRIYGRGAGDAKGQLFAGVKAVDAWSNVIGELPLNVKLVYIGDEETGCPTLAETVLQYRELLKADAVLFTDASTLDVWGPVLFLANRGVLALELVARGSDFGAHSGSYGGLIRNPGLRLIHALASLRDASGHITVDGFFDDLRQLGETERYLLSRLEVDKLKKLRTLGTNEFWGDPGYSYFETQMYRPTLNIHSLTSGYQGNGWMAQVPSTASAKIDINIVPNLNPVDIQAKIRDHLNARGFDDIDVNTLANIPYAAASSLDDPFLKTVSRVQQRVWGVEPVIYPSIGGGGDIVKAFKETLGIPHFLFVPLAQPDLNEHTPFESLDIDWYIKGIQLIAALFSELSDSCAILERPSHPD